MLAVDALLMGCTDKRSAQLTVDHALKTVSKTMPLMRQFHDHEKGLSVESRVLNRAMEEVDPVTPQVNRVPNERSSSLYVGKLIKNIVKLTKLLAT